MLRLPVFLYLLSAKNSFIDFNKSCGTLLRQVHLINAVMQKASLVSDLQRDEYQWSTDQRKPCLGLLLFNIVLSLMRLQVEQSSSNQFSGLNYSSTVALLFFVNPTSTWARILFINPASIYTTIIFHQSRFYLTRILSSIPLLFK